MQFIDHSPAFVEHLYTFARQTRFSRPSNAIYRPFSRICRSSLHVCTPTIIFSTTKCNLSTILPHLLIIFTRLHAYHNFPDHQTQFLVHSPPLVDHHYTFARQPRFHVHHLLSNRLKLTITNR